MAQETPLHEVAHVQNLVTLNGSGFFPVLVSNFQVRVVDHQGRVCLPGVTTHPRVVVLLLNLLLLKFGNGFEQVMRLRVGRSALLTKHLFVQIGHDLFVAKLLFHFQAHL